MITIDKKLLWKIINQLGKEEKLIIRAMKEETKAQNQLEILQKLRKKINEKLAKMKYEDYHIYKNNSEAVTDSA